MAKYCFKYDHRKNIIEICINHWFVTFKGIECLDNEVKITYETQKKLKETIECSSSTQLENDSNDKVTELCKLLLKHTTLLEEFKKRIKDLPNDKTSYNINSEAKKYLV